jgi:hypothetical protein
VILERFGPLFSVSLRQQQIATIPDRDLRRIGETLQQPRQRNFQPGMILRDIHMTNRCLPQRAHAKNQAITLPSFLVNLKNGNAGGRTGQAGLDAARSLFTAKAMGIETMSGADIF